MRSSGFVSFGINTCLTSPFPVAAAVRLVPLLLPWLGDVQPISYIETSAKEAVKVEGAFLEVVQMALINSAQQPPEM